jgi:hypothetical protein
MLKIILLACIKVFILNEKFEKKREICALINYRLKPATA